MPRGIHAQQTAACRRRANRVKKVRVQAKAVFDTEQLSTGFDHPYSNVVTQHDRIQQFGAGGPLPLRHGHGRVHDGGARVATDNMRAVDLLPMARSTVGQSRVHRRHAHPGRIDPGFRRASQLRCIPRTHVASQAAGTEVGTSDLVEDHQLGALHDCTGQRGTGGRRCILRNTLGQGAGHVGAFNPS